MDILKEVDTRKVSYVLVRKGDTTYKIKHFCYEESFYDKWAVQIQLVRDLWINKTLLYHTFGEGSVALDKSYKYYKDLIAGFDTNNQFK